MTWMNFAFCLAGVNAAYYALVIMGDQFRGRGGTMTNETDELAFADDAGPVRVGPQSMPEDAVMSSGGVSLKQLFSLAREDAIEFTRPVSY